MPPVLPPPDVSQTTISVPAEDNISGHIKALEQASVTWPGESIRIISEGLNGANFEMTLTHGTRASLNEGSARAESPEQPDTIKTPTAVIFLLGDGQDFGKMPRPPTPGKPVIVATRGDAEDHRHASSKWAAALRGETLLWDAKLAWKYRTQTVVFKDETTGRTIIEQSGLAADCGTTGDDVRASVEQCLASPDQDGEGATKD